MNYEKVNTIAYNLHLIKTNKFKNIKIKINFKRKMVKEEIVYRNMLVNLLMESTKNYPNARLIEIASEDMYNVGFGSNSSSSGNFHIMSFECNFLNEKYTEEGMNEKSLQFFLDFIFNPNVDDEGFNEKAFNISKSILRDDIVSYDDSPGRYSNTKLLELMVPKTPLSYNSFGYIEDLEKVNSKNLYEYYQNVLKKDLIDIFVIGDIDKNEIKKLIKDNFKIKTLKKENSNHFLENKKYKSRFHVVKETKELEQSILLMGYKLEQMTKKEKMYVSYMYSYILGGGPDSKLFKIVREKNSLCYSISASIYGVSDLMIIRSGINAKDANKAIKLIKQQVKKMQKGEFDLEDIEKARTTYLSSLKGLEDYPSSILNMYVSKEYLDYDVATERLKEIEKVTKEDIINLAKKIHPDTIFILEGSK
ncbi:MAG: insulinase family protein [Firmicutes bacterium]|nr:insulinase family protein [Bacillota bacterium]